MSAYPYADYAASYPVRPEVLEVLQACWHTAQPLGNPGSSQHPAGRRTAGLLDQARADLARVFSVEPEEIIFTSGATEACNLAILGTFQRCWQQRPDLVTVATEHPAVLEPCKHCAAMNSATQLHLAPVDAAGHCDPDQLPLSERTGLMAAMAVNNETGSCHDLQSIYQRCQTHGVPLLIDATQAWGRLPLATLPPAEFIALSGHKIGAPVGCGILIARRHLGLTPLLFGGGQQHHKRPGTENAAFAQALAIAGNLAEYEAENTYSSQARPSASTSNNSPLNSPLNPQNAAEAALTDALPGLIINCSSHARAPGICSLTLPGLPSGWLAATKAQLASGSACSSQRGQPSHVLTALGYDRQDASNSLRISLPANADATTWQKITDLVIAGAKQVQRA
jgi:cysteine desulfurase